MSLAERVKGYLDRVEDIDYLERILDEVPLPSLFQVLLELLQSSSASDVAIADCFIRDIRCRANKNNGEFNAKLVVAGIPTTYQRNVFARNFWIRRTTISTLMVSEETWWPTAELANALTFLEANDPLLLPDIIRIQMGRSRWKDWSSLNRLTDSLDFLVRWSVLGVLDNCCVRFPLPELGILSETKSYLLKLQHDDSALVKAEADFVSATLGYFEIMPTLTKPEKRRRSKAMNEVAPKPRFSDLRNLVDIELNARQKTDFTLEELHQFLNCLSKP